MADPTPAEIEARCKEIQAGWSDRERESRGIGARISKPQQAAGAEALADAITFCRLRTVHRKLAGLPGKTAV